MTMPREYAHASDEFAAFMADARTELGFDTNHMTYTTVQGVLQVFRRRLTIDEAIAFAAVLPAVLRAIFVSDWDVRERPVPFDDPASMNREVMSLRRDHNFSPVDAIPRVARALRRQVDNREFERVLSGFSPEAASFWSIGRTRADGP